MDAHASPHDQPGHPTPAVYIKIALILAVLTVLEVMAFEAAGGGLGDGLRSVVAPVVILLLVVLSAVKFALVAMFYMHLKQDPRVLSNIFVFPLIIGGLLVVGLILLFAYWRVQGAR